MTKKSKAETVLEMLNKGMTTKEITNKIPVSPSYVWKLKQTMAHAAPEQSNEVFVGKIEDITYGDLAELAYNVTRGKQGRRAKPGEYIEVEGELTPNEIDAILEERGARYGDFLTHAEITQRLKQMAYNYINDNKLAADQIEALDMIFHKIGRIINGDPDYADSWVDIAGYAKLVADRLQGVER